MDDVIFDENHSHTYAYMVVGWLDGDSYCKSFPNYKSAFRDFKRVVGLKDRHKWFLDIMMITWGPVPKDTPGGHLLKAVIVDITYLYNEGTYDYFYMKADKEADAKIDALFNGEETDA